MKPRQLSELKQFLSTDPGQQIISQQLHVADYFSLERTNHSLLNFFNSHGLKFWLAKFIHYVAKSPHDDWVRFILKHHPQLLEHVFTEVKLQSRTVTNVNALQFAFGAKDDVMCQTLIPFYKIKYGKAALDIMLEQINELKYDHKPFDFGTIIQAISNETFKNGCDDKGRLILSPATYSEIEKFRKDFDATQPKIIDKGMHFRWETLMDFYKLYITAAQQWDRGNPDFLKCALLEDAVWSWVLGYAPENGAQYFKQGLLYLFRGSKPERLDREGKTSHDRDFYFDLKKPSFDFVLEGHRDNIFMGPVPYLDPDVGDDNLALLSDFILGKNSHLLLLFPPPPTNPSRSNRRMCIIS